MGVFQKLFGHEDNKRKEMLFEDEASKRDLRKRQETRRRLALLQAELDVLRRATDR